MPQCYLAGVWLQALCAEWIRLLLFPAVCTAVAANHSIDNSQCRLLTVWWTALKSLIKKWWEKYTCVKSEKSSGRYTSMYKSMYVYTSMDITTELIAAMMGKGRDDTREVVGQDLFASLTGCRLSTVVCVCEVLWQATTMLTSWRLWRGWEVTQVCDSPESPLLKGGMVYLCCFYSKRTPREEASVGLDISGGIENTLWAIYSLVCSS